MSAFTVHVTTTTGSFGFIATGTDSAAVNMAAIEKYGVCAVFATPA